MTETSRAEIDLEVFGQIEKLACCQTGQENHSQVLQNCSRLLDLVVNPVGEMSGLLKEDGVFGRDLTDIDGDSGFLGREDAVHHWDVLSRCVGGDAEDQDPRLQCVLLVLILPSYPIDD